VTELTLGGDNRNCCYWHFLILDFCRSHAKQKRRDVVFRESIKAFARKHMLVWVGISPKKQPGPILNESE
jgi:hypothetical protein